MLTFKGTTLFFIFVLIGMAIYGLIQDFPLPYFIIPITIYISIVAYGSASIQSGFFMNVISKGDASVPEIAITFDDGPHPETTPAILDILKQNKITATFFCIGERAAENPDLIRRIVDEGHILGNHSHSHHVFFNLFSKKNMVRELRACNRTIEKMIGKRMLMFRPPYGVTNPSLAKAVEEVRITPIGWSLRSMDTVTKDPGKLVQKINSKLGPGDIILMHDTKKVTVEALPEIINLVRQKELTVKRIDDLLKIHEYA